jgi:hypothetical protein
VSFSFCALAKISGFFSTSKAMFCPLVQDKIKSETHNRKGTFNKKI